MNNLIRAAIVLVALLTSSCFIVVPLPIPARDTEVPAVEGALTDAGLPVANKTVVYNWRQTQGTWQASADALTSPAGQFSFSAKKKFRFTETFGPKQECGFEYSLAVKSPEGEVPLMKDNLFGPCEAPKRFKVRCDLAKSGMDRCEVLEGPMGNERRMHQAVMKSKPAQ